LGEALTADKNAHPEGQWNSGLRLVLKLGLPAGQQHPALPDSLMKWGLNLYSPVLADNATVFVGGNWNAYATRRNDRSILWEVKLPGMPVLGGLSLTRAGDVLVPLIDWRVLCIGGKE
jgi:hypothetical protein